MEGRSEASTQAITALTAAQKEQTRQNANFASTSERLTHRSLGSTRQSNRAVKLAKSMAELEAVNFVDVKDSYKSRTLKKNRASDYEFFTGNSIAFDNTSPRFKFDQVFYGEPLKFDIPGPGYYQIEKVSNISSSSLPKNKQRSKNQCRPVTF